MNLAKQEGPQAIIQTNLGTIKLQLFDKQAPKTVKNFIELAKKEYYDGVIFHRIIPDFMIQGGDPTGSGAGGQSIYGENFEDEFSSELFNLQGALSMANAGPNTNGSQFFIVTNKNLPENMISQMQEAGYPLEIVEAYKNGGTPWLDFRHTVFGQVIEGMDIVDTIEKVPTGPQDRPVDDVIIDSIEIKD
ncbi:peptidylprolyl isomerase [Tetragenococcus halophilus]|uniref:Peptidyl-prolyl cis-trans isomerase n=4 Tax=Tetragenococcus halophilus TaxID=51669 RepID=A0A2H6DM61_TETHA|nr:peptidylprolyl isomerase [Tetragenococcus halophilus]MCF1602659.1 peptidylprolyl isomerase [Tetragenococcus halophilus]MCF1676797.1 peptidylprolyl isomerase [Tetragenococcus halophilus]MCO7027592.1 peptidylprolyl isomerase [Tetragenococcus halophilus]MCO8285447.1 peptidylprolyl isomerase [Tetragenococcus halophilus]MCO8287746.1 peptidylprolyl isomerase [Tetragenococcus halophilus]